MPRVARPPQTIGIVGSRRRNADVDYRNLVEAFDKVYRPGDCIVSGGCPKGGDAFAEAIARSRGLTITIHYPDWNGPAGKAAGFVRNTKIAEDADVLLALVAEDRTGGTEDTIRKALKLGKKVIILE